MNFTDFLLQSPPDEDRPFLLGKEKLSHEELLLQVQLFASYLRYRFGENQNIILCSPNNIFFIVSYLSIIKSGNVCIPVDPSITAGNLKYIVNETSAAVLLRPNLSKADIEDRVIAVFDEKDFADVIIAKELLYPFDAVFDENRIAEIIFTSGSTGRPKGVVISHKNLIANTLSVVEYLKITENDRILVVLPFYYCYGLSLLHTHLKAKGSVVINSSFVFTGGVINDLIKFKCTGFAGVPSHYQILLRKTKSFLNMSFPDLRYVTQAGGKLHNVFIEEFNSIFPQVEFFVMYGQTEATARLSYLPPALLRSKLGSIGKGIPGVELKVVDQNYREVKPGETGEIIARGDNIMVGYYKDEELTRQTFYNGWLKTGDLAVTDDDGFIFLTARSKEILKIRGKRVSPKEIEEIILNMKEVVDCSVIAIDDEIEGEALTAQVVLQDEFKDKINSQAIIDFCSLYLEQFKVPSRILFLEKMNINSTGKKVKAFN